jgi:hypothetical protein
LCAKKTQEGNILSQDPCFFETFTKLLFFGVNVAKFLVMAIIGSQTMHWGVCFLGRDYNLLLNHSWDAH